MSFLFSLLRTLETICLANILSLAPRGRGLSQMAILPGRTGSTIAPARPQVFVLRAEWIRPSPALSAVRFPVSSRPLLRARRTAFRSPPASVPRHSNRLGVADLVPPALQSQTSQPLA